MSINICLGIPRSGKTYYATYQIYEFFLNEKSKIKNKEYDFCYTNINQFAYEKSEKFKKYEHDIFYEQLKILYSMYCIKKSDFEILEKAKEFNIPNSLFVIDECHNDFLYGKKDNILIWFLTYHGHLFVDIIFITQNLSLLPKEYKKLAEFIIQAIPPSRRIFNNRFRYKVFTSYLMYSKDKDKDFTIPKLNEVFELYVSGSINNTKSSFHKYVKLIIFLVLLSLLGLNFLFYQMKPKKEKNENSNFQVNNSNSNLLKTNVNPQKNNANNDFLINKSNYENTYFYKVTCINYKTCIINNEYTINYELFEFVSKNSDPIFKKIISFGSSVVQINLIYDFDIFKNLKNKTRKDLNKNDKESSNLFNFN